MSTLNTPTPPSSNNLHFIYKMPSKTFIAGTWGKPGEKPAEKQQGFAGLDNNKANQVAAESLLDLGNADILKVVQDPVKNPIKNATMKGVISTLPEATNPIKRINKKQIKNFFQETIVVLSLSMWNCTSIHFS